MDRHDETPTDTPAAAVPPSELERLRDENARLRCELDALRANEQRFRALIERSTDVLYVLDARLVITLWSPGAEAALGWTAGEAVGAFGPEFVHPDDAGAMRPPDPGAAPGPGDRFIYRVRHRDGGWRELDAIVRNHLADPILRGVIVNARDVTETRRLEARAAEAEKLEHIGRLAGSVAHDFNNLLTVILNCGELARQPALRGEPSALEDIDEMIGAAERARALTARLLAFARRQPFAPVTLDVNAALRAGEGLLRRLCGDRVVPTLSLAPRPCLVRCDPTQLEQVILNLVVNARDAMPGGGRVELSTELVTPSDDDAPRRSEAATLVRLRVRDHGVGISPEVRERLFEPFFTTKPAGEGTGLGLATVYGVVRQSGGVIEVASEPGVGSTFDVLLPLVGSPALPSGRPRESAASAA